MKKPNKKIVASLCATSLATIGFISYKTIKKKNPDILKELKNKYPKFNIFKNEEDTDTENEQYTNNTLFYTETKPFQNKEEKIFSPKVEPKTETLPYYNDNEKDKDILEKSFEEEKTQDKQDIDIITEQAIQEDNTEEEDNNEQVIQEDNTEEEDNKEQNIQENNQEDEKDIQNEEKTDLSLINQIGTEFDEDFIQGLKKEIDELMNFEKDIEDIEKDIQSQKTIIYEPVYKNKKKALAKSKDEEEKEVEVTLPDEYIEDEVRYQLCLTNKEKITNMTLKKLERIDFFEIDDVDIDTYCEFLSKYTKIKSIVIDSLNPIKNNDDILNYKNQYSLKDISPLTKLQSLEELSFNWGIENIDFSSLSELPNLKKLELKFGMIDDMSFLYGLKNLEHLEIMLSSNVKDISGLVALKNLKKLYLYTNAKVELDALKDMESLKYVYINGESISI